MARNKICVGAIAGAFGVRGEARIKSFCANPKDILKYTPFSDGDDGTFTMKGLRDIAGGFAARFEEIQTKEIADALKGTRLYADRDRFPDLSEDEFYHTDLIGLLAFNGHGEKVGKVKSVQNFGAGDLLELHVDRKTVLIPFTQANIPTIDLSAGRLVIDPPEGLLE